MKTEVSGADFWDFELKAEFVGKFLNPVIREKDSDQGKAGEVMGFNFEGADGNIHIIGASHSIEKLLTSEGHGSGMFYRITFLGKGENAKGQPFNKFKIDSFDDEAEYKAYVKK